MTGSNMLPKGGTKLQSLDSGRKTTKKHITAMTSSLCPTLMCDNYRDQRDKTTC